MNLSRKISLPIASDGVHQAYIRMHLGSNGVLVPTMAGQKALGHLDEDANATHSPGGRKEATIYRTNAGGSHYAILADSVVVGDGFIGADNGRIAKCDDGAHDAASLGIVLQAGNAGDIIRVCYF